MNDDGKLVQEFVKYQQERIKAHKSFQRLLKEYKTEKNENIYKKKIEEITLSFNKISLSIISIIKSLKSEKVKSMIQELQRLEAEHLNISVIFHQLELKKIEAEKKYKDVVNSEIKSNIFPGYLDVNMVTDKEIIRGEVLESISKNLKKNVKEKQNIVTKINDLFDEIKFSVDT